MPRPSPRRRRRLAACPLLVAAALLAACGSSGSSDAPAGTARGRPVDLVLDFTPNAVHAPLFAAVDTGADRRHGIHLRLRQPGGGPDALKLVTGGRALVGVLDIHDLAVARAKGVDVVAIGALVQRPLAALLALPSVRRPRDLAGRTVGVSGLPSDPAFLDAIVRQDGGDPARVRQVTIGFKAVPALVARRVDAVPAFWNAEGVALARRGVRVRQFRVEDYGAPPYPEVVLFTTRRTLDTQRPLLRATLAAIGDGVRAVRSRPADAVRGVTRRAGAGDPELVRAQLDAVLPLFSPPLRFDRRVLERWARFDARIGIVRRRPDVGRAFAFGLAP